MPREGAEEASDGEPHGERARSDGRREEAEEAEEAELGHGQGRERAERLGETENEGREKRAKKNMIEVKNLIDF